MHSIATVYDQANLPSLDLHPLTDDPQYFNLSILPIADFPLDLYILMDFSSSLENPLVTLRGIATDISES